MAIIEVQPANEPPARPETRQSIDVDLGRDIDAAQELCRQASRELYEVEVALHAARQSGVDSWVLAAGERLHAAVQHYEAAREFVAGVRVRQFRTADDPVQADQLAS